MMSIVQMSLGDFSQMLQLVLAAPISAKWKELKFSYFVVMRIAHFKKKK